jgi:hypothetical protein
MKIGKLMMSHTDTLLLMLAFLAFVGVVTAGETIRNRNMDANKVMAEFEKIETPFDNRPSSPTDVIFLNTVNGRLLITPVGEVMDFNHHQNQGGGVYGSLITDDSTAVSSPRDRSQVSGRGDLLAVENVFTVEKLTSSEVEDIADVTEKLLEAQRLYELHTNNVKFAHGASRPQDPNSLVLICGRTTVELRGDYALKTSTKWGICATSATPRR